MRVVESNGKSRENSRRPPTVQPHGGALIPGAGRGPKKGAANAGRPRDEWKSALAALVSSDEVLTHVRDVLADPTHPQWMRAMEFASERGFGKESVDLTTAGASFHPRQYIMIGGQRIEF